MIDSTTLNIGTLARLAQVNIQTIRYYERRGLLPEPERTVGNYRVYTSDSAVQVRFIKRAQGLGFTLNEIKELLEIRASSDSCCRDVCDKSSAKIASITDKIRSLEIMRTKLTALVDQCSGEGPLVSCSILDSLTEEL